MRKVYLSAFVIGALAVEACSLGGTRFTAPNNSEVTAAAGPAAGTSSSQSSGAGGSLAGTASGSQASGGGSGGAIVSGSGGTVASSSQASGGGSGGAIVSSPQASAVGSGGAIASSSTGGGAPSAGYPAGWLYTNGGGIYLSSGDSTGKPWMGRGVNIDDIFLCGYNSTLDMASPDVALEAITSGLVKDWKANFVRISLSMNSYKTVSWLGDSRYATPMTNVIDAIAAAKVYVMVTLRSDPSMIDEEMAGDPEATGLPSDASNTPDPVAYPTGTDATYVALVDAFASSSFVLFGVSNEPGGHTLSNEVIGAAMNHAVGVVRAEEDRLGVPHHIVSVQGSAASTDIGFYAATPAPITHDNVVYEVHGYPPLTASYTHPEIPVIVGLYAELTKDASAAFFADLEAKKIPSLAWDFDPFSNCAPDLLQVTQSASGLMPSEWGAIVQDYLSTHAP